MRSISRSRRSVRMLCEALEVRQLMSLTVEVRNSDGSASGTVTSVGQVLNLEVLAVISSSSNDPTQSGLQDLTGSFISTANGQQSVAGSLAATNISPFHANGSSTGKQQDLNGDGNTDVGSTDPQSDPNYFTARASSLQSSDTGTIVGNTLVFEVATLSYTVTKLNSGGQTSINFVPLSDTLGSDEASWVENGVGTYPSIGGVFAAGTAYTVTDPALIVAPTAVNDSATVAINTATDIRELANDTVIQPLNPASVTVTQAASHGTTAVQSDGSILYTPVHGYTGPDSFEYSVADVDGRRSNAATVNITVSPAAAPTAGYVSDSTFVDQPVTVAVLPHDSSVATLVPSSVTVVGAPGHGTAVAQSDGSIIYTPASGFTGSDSFTYTVSDSNNETSAAATVSIDVQVPVPPTANNDSFNVIAGTPTTLNVLANDVLGSIATGTTVHVGAGILGVEPSHGTAVVQSDETILYTPTAGYIGTDTFSYLLTDTLGDASDSATVTLTIGAALPPTAAGVVAPVLSGTTGTINVLSSVTGQAPIVTSSVTVATPPTDGTAIVNTSTGAITYTPIAGFVGTDTFTYTAADTNGNTAAPATVTVNVGTSISSGKGQNHSLSFTDAAGGLETISLNTGTAEIFFSGTGSLTTSNSRATVAGKSLDLGSIELTGTTKASALSFRGSAKTPVTLGGISDASPLGSISASGAMVSGTISLNSAASVTLGNISDATITVAAGAPGRTSLTAGAISNSNFSSAVPIAVLKAASWTGTGTITAPSIGSLQIAGAFAPSLILTATGKSSALASARIGGAVGDGTAGSAWNISGGIGSVSVKTGGFAAPLAAGSIGSLTIGGNLTSNITSQAAVQSIRISGGITNAELGFNTTLGALSVGGAVSGATIDSGGSIRSISASSITGSTVDVAIGQLDITGSTFTLSDSTLTLSTATAAAIGSGTLGSFRSGSFGSTTLLVGSLGSASLGAITTANGGSAFGIGTKKLASFSGVFSGTTVRLGRPQLANQEVLSAYLQEQTATTGDFGIFLES